MKTQFGFSMKMRFAFTYLLVALGSILSLGIVSFLTIHILIINFQQQALQESAITLAQQLGVTVSNRQVSLQQAVCSIEICAPSHQQSISNNLAPRTFLLTDTKNNVFIFTHQEVLAYQLPSQSDIGRSLADALQGKTESGNEQTLRSFPNTHYLATPIHKDGSSSQVIIGALYLLDAPAAPPFTIRSDFFAPRNIFSDLSILPILFIALIMATLGALLSRTITRPLTEINTAAQRVASGDYSYVVPVRRNDELGQVARSFNHMSAEIAAQVQALQRQEQRRRELISNVAHDLAIPLTAIQGNIEALEDGTAQGMQKEKSRQVISTELARLKRLVGELQELSRLESSTLEVEQSSLDLTSLIEQTVIVLEPEFTKKGVRLEIITSKLPAIVGDSDLVLRVLLNILDNALHYTPSGGEVTIRNEHIEDTVHLSITDTGIGIESADIEHVFDRFYRIDQTRSSTTGGSGLGLAIAQAIMQAHKGSIEAKSEVNKGTTITCIFPVSPEVTRKLHSFG